MTKIAGQQRLLSRYAVEAVKVDGRWYLSAKAEAEAEPCQSAGAPQSEARGTGIPSSTGAPAFEKFVGGRPSCRRSKRTACECSHEVGKTLLDTQMIACSAFSQPCFARIIP